MSMPSVDPCNSSSFCDDCTTKAGCGWCANEKRCRSGGTGGPAEGTCANWFNSNAACHPAGADAGTSMMPPGRGDPCRASFVCGDCVGKAGCGWCASTAQCLTGNSIGPETGACTSWGLSASICAAPMPDAGAVDAGKPRDAGGMMMTPDVGMPGGPDAATPGRDAGMTPTGRDAGAPDTGPAPCNVNLTCGGCSAVSGCGWCAEKNDCEEGTSSGPRTGFCSGWAWVPNACTTVGPGAPDMCATSVDCAACSARSGCGWCASQGRCASGSSTGPATGICSDWDFTPSACNMGGMPMPMLGCQNEVSCGGCAAKNGCGWCGDNSTCREGNATGPNASTCTAWSYTTASCGGTMTDACNTSGMCGDCTARSGCGWCASNNQCKSGTSAGPANGTCANWDWVSTSCGSDPCNTSGACTDCVQRAACGWCASSGQCQTGGSAGPAMGSCANWDYTFSSCAPPPDPCDTSNSCDSCVARSTCGWCASTGQCKTGGSTGPTTGSCSNWDYTAAQCAPPPDPCDSSASCSTCVARSTCGWCASTGECKTGGSTGPTTGTCSNWDYTSAQCAPPPDPCDSSASCSSCVARSTCGWCNSTGDCRTGGSTGPSTGSCSDWDYTSAQCAPPPDPCATGAGSATCDDCTALPGCGWCASTGQCKSGNSVGPSAGTCSVWSYTATNCDPCLLSSSCDDCTQYTSCGWCNSTGECRLGNSAGPTKVFCSDWAYVKAMCGP